MRRKLHGIWRTNLTALPFLSWINLPHTFEARIIFPLNFYFNMFHTWSSNRKYCVIKLWTDKWWQASFLTEGHTFFVYTHSINICFTQGCAIIKKINWNITICKCILSMYFMSSKTKYQVNNTSINFFQSLYIFQLLILSHVEQLISFNENMSLHTSRDIQGYALLRFVTFDLTFKIYTCMTMQ